MQQPADQQYRYAHAKRAQQISPEDRPRGSQGSQQIGDEGKGNQIQADKHNAEAKGVNQKAAFGLPVFRKEEGTPEAFSSFVPFFLTLAPFLFLLAGLVLSVKFVFVIH